MTAPVLVTGASRGIGAEISRVLAGAGTPVIGVFRSNREAATKLQGELGERCELLQADLSTDEGIDHVAGGVGGRQLGGAVFGAGIVIRRPFADPDPDGIDALRAQLVADLESPLVLCRALLRSGALFDDSSIVFLSSNIARHSVDGKVAYGAAKAGLESATRGLARELGPRRIRVNAVAPGLLRTDMTRDIGDEGFAAYAGEVPLGRVGTAADIAPLVLFLLGSGAAYITGQVIDVDGGWGS